MFHSDFIALPGNHTRNFVARHKLGFNATFSLWVRIKLATSLLDISYVSTRLRRSAWESNSWELGLGLELGLGYPARSGTAPAQLPRFDASLTTHSFLLYNNLEELLINPICYIKTPHSIFFPQLESIAIVDLVFDLVFTIINFLNELSLPPSSHVPSLVYVVTVTALAS